jgi:hypothetical protein
MTLARNRGAIEAKCAGHAHLTIADALRLLNEPSDEEREAEHQRRLKDVELARHKKQLKKFGEYPFKTTVFNVVDRMNVRGYIADLERCATHLDTLPQKELVKLSSVLKRQQADAVRIGAVIQQIDSLTQPMEKDITPKRVEPGLLPATIERENDLELETYEIEPELTEKEQAELDSALLCWSLMSERTKNLFLEKISETAEPF